jgi:hypothetical protein
MEKSNNSSSQQQVLTESEKSKLRTYKSRYINKHKMSPAEAHAAALHDVLNPRRKTSHIKSKAKSSPEREAEVIQEPVAQTGSDGIGRVIEFPRLRTTTATSEAVTVAGLETSGHVAPLTATTNTEPATIGNVAPQPATPSNTADVTPTTNSVMNTADGNATNNVAPVTTTPIEVAPLGFVAPPPVTLTETSYNSRFSWSATPAPTKPKMSLFQAQVQVALSGAGLLICLTALVIFQARAGHMSLEAIFWAIMSEVAGVVLWAYPTISRLNKIALRFLGTLFITLGFLVMHADVESGTTRLVETRVSSALSVTTLESQIERKKDSLNVLVADRDKLPATYLTARVKVQDEIQALESEVTELENRLLSERRLVAESKTAAVVQRLGDIEDARRFGLVLLAIACAHGFFAAFPVLFSSRKASITV